MDFAEESEGEQEEEMTQEQRNEGLFQAVKENNVEMVEEYLNKQAISTFEKDGWNPLLWAACNGNEDIVRLLIKHNAHSIYIQQQQKSEGSEKENADDTDDPFVKPKDAAKVGKYTPMHWASFHGHYKVVWLLLQAGMSPLEIDMHGNTSVHQAASNAESLRVLKCFMSRGCDIAMKNARGHTPLDLATDKTTRKLIEKAFATAKCKGKMCGGSKFDFKNIRYYCEMSTDFYCRQCSHQSWVYENKDSEAKERPVCRYINCQDKVEKAQNDLSEAMDTNEFYALNKVLTGIVNDQIDIDVKLLHQAENLHLKLEKELDIRNFITSVAHVDNYKTILKSVKVLNDKRDAAEALGVKLDPVLIESINQCTSRLISERNLRFQMDNTHVSSSTHQTIDELQALIDKARENSVEEVYMEQANKLSGQMNGNLQAREIYQMLHDYPQREYPEPEPLDAKGKPVKKDPKAKPKKKGKKVQFPTPEWALELDDVIKQVKSIQQLVADAQNLHLEPTFLADVAAELKRFTQEINFRKEEEAEARAEAEAKALAKKKAAAAKKK